MYGHHLLYSRVMRINRVRLPSLLVVSSTGKLNVLADASVVRTYIYTGTVLLLYLFIYQVYVKFGDIHVHSCTVQCCICIYV